MKTFAESAISFFASLSIPENLPEGVVPLFPYNDPPVKELVRKFYTRFFSDTNLRFMLVGINPGRFGAGITGINFTAPRQLREDCGISHELGNSSELSAEFIYSVINAFGGAKAFYRHFYLAAVSPVGFVQNGKNLNYYDDPRLMASILPYALDCMQRQLRFGVHRTVAICIGGDKNYKFLKAMNEAGNFFAEILTVPHPRFILQYRRSSQESYIQQYLSALDYCLHK
ncbi:uracil-DNA glycosylase family protein [Flavihumibacter fluvii]|uniref:uracil-DNA glycosylase family protein n=1 Tax=Flavihumibacter fluvii TaxID=2838157 RepID=UPI001BDF426C|nr:uracil-DNA glycosylase family protein [Flavihumibacter fluvii]ULQ52222.1 DUF4918 family protein [Flavihumibacter fluvii]